MVIYDGLPYELYEKMQKIEDKTFRDALTLAILPNFEELIEYKRKNNKAVNDYENTFSQCKMSYEERMNNVIDLLKKMDITKPLEYNNLDYLNTKFGDCVIPYPDKENIGKDIEGSFALLSRKSLELNVEKNINPELIALYLQEKELFSEYNNKQSARQSKLEKGEKI